MRPQHYISRILLAAILLAAVTGARGQQTARWDVIDATTMRYYGDYQQVVAAADERDIVVIGTDPYLPYAKRLRRTSDGGATWRDALVDTTRTRWLSIAHPSPSLIVVVGDTAEYLGYDGNFNYKYHGRYMLSRDGGETWGVGSLDSNTRVEGVSMCSDRHGVMGVVTPENVYNTAPGLLPNYLLRTDDGWRTTTTIPLPKEYVIIWQIICPAPDVYILLAHHQEQQRKVILRTTDGGKSWQSSDKVDKIENMSFLNADIGWSATGENTGIGVQRRDVIMKTTDGGMTWETVLNQAIGARPFGLMAIDFADEKNGIAVGTEHKILRTTDGGASWNQEFPPSVGPKLPIRYILYLKPDAAVAVYSEGPIIRYAGDSILLAPTFVKPTGYEPLEVENIAVEWTPIDGATKYQLVMAGITVGASSWDTTIYQNPILDTIMSGTGIVLNALQYNYVYYARVRAFSETQSSHWQRAEGLFYTKKSIGAVAPPKIITPEVGAMNQPTTVTVGWESVPSAMSYDLQIGDNPAFFGDLVVNDSLIQETSRVVGGLKPDVEYFVHVRARYAGGVTNWSSIQSFRTGATSAVPDDRRITEARLLVGPNPVRSVVTIDGGEIAGGGVLKLYDALGRLVRSVDVGERFRIALDVADLPEGVYTVEVTAVGGDRRRTRLVVMR